MICPNCGKDHNEVTKSTAIGSVVKRRRYCSSCVEAFITTERYVEDKPIVSLPPKRERLSTKRLNKESINLAHLKNRSRPVWLVGEINGWGIIEDYEDGDFYIYTKKGGQWIGSNGYKRSWWAFEDVREMRKQD